MLESLGTSASFATLAIGVGPRAPGATHPLQRRTLEFPRDFGSHPDRHIEWWYVTGYARSSDADAQAAVGSKAPREFGFQVTFFRSRVDAAQELQSAFAAKQLIFAHSAVTDLSGDRLWHDQRIARAGMGVALASEPDTDVRLRDWSLMRGAADGGAYRTRIVAEQFALDLRFAPTQPLLLQGDEGLSRKGPAPAQVSYYYSEPQLATRGALTLQGRRFDVEGKAWLDHEWSDAFLHPEAVGWDWIGMNLDDGAALTAFRLRRADGSALWAGGSWRSAKGETRIFTHEDTAFEPLRMWRSPASGAAYPVDTRVRTPVGNFIVKALIDDQELDSRNSTGAIYWEGLSSLRDARGGELGRGYLEMTGYAGALRL